MYYAIGSSHRCIDFTNRRTSSHPSIRWKFLCFLAFGRDRDPANNYTFYLYLCVQALRCDLPVANITVWYRYSLHRILVNQIMFLVIVFQLSNTINFICQRNSLKREEEWRCSAPIPAPSPPLCAALIALRSSRIRVRAIYIYMLYMLYMSSSIEARALYTVWRAAQQHRQRQRQQQRPPRFRFVGRISLMLSYAFSFATSHSNWEIKWDLQEGRCRWAFASYLADHPVYWIYSVRIYTCTAVTRTHRTIFLIEPKKREKNINVLILRSIDLADRMLSFVRPLSNSNQTSFVWKRHSHPTMCSCEIHHRIKQPVTYLKILFNLNGMSRIIIHLGVFLFLHCGCDWRLQRVCCCIIWPNAIWSWSAVGWVCVCGHAVFAANKNRPANNSLSCPRIMEYRMDLDIDNGADSANRPTIYNLVCNQDRGFLALAISPAHRLYIYCGNDSSHEQTTLGTPGSRLMTYFFWPPVPPKRMHCFAPFKIQNAPSHRNKHRCTRYGTSRYLLACFVHS